MKQIIPFVKDLKLKTKIHDITSIALEHDLKLENNDSVVGVFKVSGKYKINDISINEDDFDLSINFDITLDDKYDASKVKIDIDDFYYEIINEEYIRVHIDVLVDNLFYLQKTYEIKEEEPKEIVEILADENLERNDNLMDNILVEEEIKEDKKEKINLTNKFINMEENYSTYKVHIIREDETIDTIIEKYEVKKEELLKYNDLENIMLGSKIIIPINNE